ncbi:hypothetical protein FB565_006935 [Actinoplanes lutulentus]|nr:hypothetical protein [Actinoplanes lutulentus]
MVEPGTIGLDGYRAMDDRTALTVLIRIST